MRANLWFGPENVYSQPSTEPQRAIIYRNYLSVGTSLVQQHCILRFTLLLFRFDSAFTFFSPACQASHCLLFCWRRGRGAAVGLIGGRRRPSLYRDLSHEGPILPKRARTHGEETLKVTATRTVGNTQEVEASNALVALLGDPGGASGVGPQQSGADAGCTKRACANPPSPWTPSSAGKDRSCPPGPRVDAAKKEWQPSAQRRVLADSKQAQTFAAAVSSRRSGTTVRSTQKVRTIRVIHVLLIISPRLVFGYDNTSCTKFGEPVE